METKTCCVCKQEKNIDQFRRSYCIPCKKEYEKGNNHLRRKWNDKHKDRKSGYDKKYLSKPGVKEKVKQQAKQWKEKNKDYLKNYMKKYTPEYRKNKMKNDSLFKLTNNIRSAIYCSFYEKNFTKSKRTEEILGCSFEEFKQHLESQFEPWMNWDNRGGHSITEQNKTWDIDHIVPLNTAKTEEDIIKLNHYTNFKPVCSYYNRYIKRDKLV